MQTHLDLFSGLGCWAIAARANGLRTIAFCEREEWLAAGLERTWQVPCHRDIKTFPAQDYAGRVWLLTGSPPCQSASLAGKRRGEKDDRFLWPRTIEVCDIIKPAWFVFENVIGLDGVGLDGIISSLEGIGYEVATLRIPACAVDSPQLRDRFWIVGNRTEPGRKGNHAAILQRRPERIAEPTQGGAVGHAASDDRRILLCQREPQQALHDDGRPVEGGAVGNPRGECGNEPECERRRETAPGGPTQSRPLADGDNEQARGAEPPGQENRPWARTGGLAVRSLWQDHEWIKFNDAVYRAPTGLYGMADEFAARIPRKFRAKLISALGNAIVWPVASQIIAAIVSADPAASGKINT